MPKMNGYSLTSKIRSTPSMSNANIMINSSLSNDVSKDIAYKSGANSFLSKFNPNAIQKELLNSISCVDNETAEQI
jgi:two-component system chemotaxis response regulator CheV